MFYTLSRLLHGYLPKQKNNFTCCVFLQLPFVVLIRVIDRPRRWRHLATESAGDDKLSDYLRSDMKDNHSTFLDRGHYMQRSLLKNNSPPEVGKAHASEQSVPQHWEERVIIIIIL